LKKFPPHLWSIALGLALLTHPLRAFSSLGEDALAPLPMEEAYELSPRPIEKKLYVIRPNPEAPQVVSHDHIVTHLAGVGATPEVKINGQGLNPLLTSVSAYLSPPVFTALSRNPHLIISEEISMSASGINSSPDPSLVRIGEAFSKASTYHFPETFRPVRLYLIDTAIATSQEWISKNPKLSVEQTILIRGSSDPETSSSFTHATQLLSLVGGIDTGAAPGTPLNIINYDIYPNGNSTSVSLLAKAVTEAVRHYRDSPEEIPSAICIATSSSTPASSYTLRSAIETAIANGIPVIVSAGNLGADASLHIPSAYGTLEGVICIGSSDLSGTPLPSSNHGAPVDLLAPGLNLRTHTPDSSGAYGEMTGTSPAAALTTALALIEMSANGQRTPAAVEAALKSSAKPSSPLSLLRSSVSPVTDATLPERGTSSTPTEAPDGPITTPSSPTLLGQTATPSSSTATTPSPDQDADGSPDSLEVFHGSDPSDAASLPLAPFLSTPSGGKVSYTFPIAPFLLDSASPFILQNNYTWSIECSDSLKTWQIPFGHLSKSTDDQGRIWLTALLPAETKSCFVRLAVTPP
jgi:Subtilase family